MIAWAGPRPRKAKPPPCQRGTRWLPSSCFLLLRIPIYSGVQGAPSPWTSLPWLFPVWSFGCRPKGRQLYGFSDIGNPGFYPGLGRGYPAYLRWASAHCEAMYRRALRLFARDPYLSCPLPRLPPNAPAVGCVRHPHPFGEISAFGFSFLFSFFLIHWLGLRTLFPSTFEPILFLFCP